MMRMVRYLLLGSSIVAAAGCGGGESVSVRVEPGTLTLVPHATYRFDAIVGGSYGTGVTWSIEGGRSDAGEIDEDGVYTAPGRVPQDNAIVLLATSRADRSKVGRAVVSIVPVPFSPARGTTAGGTRVTVHGEGFDAANPPGVRFGTSYGLDVDVESPVLLRVTSPPSATGLGAVDVTLERPGEEPILWPLGFHYAANTFVFDGLRTVPSCGSEYQSGGAVGDLDKDLDMDVAFACYLTGELMLFLNDGAGSLDDVRVIPGASYGINDLLLADMDVDGDADLVTWNGSTADVLYNDGTATFVPHATFDPVSYLDYLVAADMTGDGKPDLVTGFSQYNATSGNYDMYVQIGRNDPGGFTALTPTLARANAYFMDLIATDLSGDGSLEPVMTWYNFNNGNGGVFLPETGVSIPIGSYVYSVTAASVTNPATRDLLVIYSGGVTQLGFNTLGQHVETNPLPALGSFGYLIGSADLDNDGSGDVVSWGQEYDSASGFFVTTARVGWGPVDSMAMVETDFSLVEAVSDLSFVDLDGDSLPEIIAAGRDLQVLNVNGLRDFGPTDLPLAASAVGTRMRNDGHVIVAIENAGGNAGLSVAGPDLASFATVMLPAASGNARAILGAEFTGDGLEDAILVADAAWLFASDPDVGFLPPEPINLDVLGADPAYPGVVGVGDLDGDGLVDVVGASSAGVQVIWGDAQPGIGFPQAIEEVLLYDPSRVAIADLDGDGLGDLLIPDRAGARVVILPSEPGRQLGAPLVLETGSMPVDLIVADLDLDWTPDILVQASYVVDPGSATTLTEVDVFLGLGAFEFAPVDRYRFGSIDPFGPSGQFEGHGLVLADLDGDDLSDLVLPTEQPRGFAILRGRDGGEFSDPEFVGAGGLPWSVAADDADGDGRVDVFLADRATGAVRKLTNQSF